MNNINEDNNTANNVGGGLGFLGLLQLLLLVLKGFNLIDWPWMIILIPLWVDLGIIVLLFIIMLIAVILTLKD